ncbi:hypothetical protein LIER_14139 [Lithospermum erythrorhizon]|uniref:Uncharacterized protein n=1 Tax=Lithospermum erythrorhizon TaxID=34254 RepID=A0AAV3PZK5_LITER
MHNALQGDTSDASAFAPVPKKSQRTAKKAIHEDAPVVNEAQLDSSRELLAASEKQLSPRPPPEVIIENFKESQNYKDIIIDDTVSIMKFFSLKVYEEFPGVHSMFPEFVDEHFGEEYEIHLTDTDESDDTEADGQSDDGLGKDEEGDGANA